MICGRRLGRRGRHGATLWRRTRWANFAILETFADGAGCGGPICRVEPGAVIPGRQLAFALLVALAALLVQERAFAAILPLCEAKAEWTTIPTAPEPSCEVVTTVDEETGETTKAAPICDPRGASAVAPQRILPVEDARIEAPRSCGGADDLLVGL